jgi:hypothetical protein
MIIVGSLVVQNDLGEGDTTFSGHRVQQVDPGVLFEYGGVA